jgi:kinesin family protein 11
LKRDLEASRDKNGVYLSTERFQEMQAEITELNTKVEGYTEEMTKVTALFEPIKQELLETKATLDVTKVELKETATTLVQTAKELEETAIDCENQKHVVAKQGETEEMLTTQANELLEVADTTVSHIKELHAKIDRKGGVVEHNHAVAIELRNGLDLKFDAMRGAAETVAQNQLSSLAEFEAKTATIMDGQLAASQALTAQLAILAPEVSNGLDGARGLTDKYVAAAATDAASQLAAVGSAGSTISDEANQFSGVQFAACTAAMHTLLESQTTAVQTMQTMMAGFFTAQTAAVNTFVAGHSEKLDALRLMTASELASQSTTLQAQKVQLAEVTAKQQESAAIAMASVQAQIGTLLQGFVSGQAAELMSATVSVGEQLNQAAVRSTEFAARTEQEFETLSSGTSQFTAAFHTSSTEQTAAADGQAGAISTGLGELDGSIDAASAMVDQYVSTVVANVATHAETMQEFAAASAVTARTFAAEHSSMVTAAEAGITGLVETSESAMATVEEGAGSQRTTTSAYSTTVQTNIGEVIEATKATTSEMQTSVDKFVNEDRKQDVSTGATPMRQPYQFGREISFTRPHDELIAELRASPLVEEDEEAEEDVDAEVEAAAEDAVAEEIDQDEPEPWALEAAAEAAAAKTAAEKEVESGASEENPVKGKVVVAALPTGKPLGTINA